MTSISDPYYGYLCIYLTPTNSLKAYLCISCCDQHRTFSLMFNLKGYLQSGAKVVVRVENNTIICTYKSLSETGQPDDRLTSW